MSKRRLEEPGRIIRGMVGRGAFMQCQVCGQEWSPNIQPGGKMPRGYRECPNGCTRDQIGKPRTPARSDLDAIMAEEDRVCGGDTLRGIPEDEE